MKKTNGVGQGKAARRKIAGGDGGDGGVDKVEKCVQPPKDDVVTRHGKGWGSGSSDKHKASEVQITNANKEAYSKPKEEKGDMGD